MNSPGAPLPAPAPPEPTEDSVVISPIQRDPSQTPIGKSKRAVPVWVLHDRLGHRSTEVLLNSTDLWNDLRVLRQTDDFCTTCKITSSRKRNRGSSKPSDLPREAGRMLALDIQYNPSSSGLTGGTHFKNYLQIVDYVSQFCAMLGMQEVSAEECLRLLGIFRTLYLRHLPGGDNPEYSLSRLQHIRADAGSQFASAEFQTACSAQGIKVTLAAPKHQEMNGLCERTWQTIRNIAFAFMSHARVSMDFFDCALEHAWKVYNVLPVKGLCQNGLPTTPYFLHYGRKPNLRHFRTMFCPVVYKVHERTQKVGKDTNRFNQKNNPQRGVLGIHCGFPKNQAGWLIFDPRSQSMRISADVQFDEGFKSMGPRRHFAFADALPVATPSTLTLNETAFPASPVATEHFGPPPLEFLEEHPGDPWIDYLFDPESRSSVPEREPAPQTPQRASISAPLKPFLSPDAPLEPSVSRLIVTPASSAVEERLVPDESNPSPDLLAASQDDDSRVTSPRSVVEELEEQPLAPAMASPGPTTTAVVVQPNEPVGATGDAAVPVDERYFDPASPATRSRRPRRRNPRYVGGDWANLACAEVSAMENLSETDFIDFIMGSALAVSQVVD